MRKMLGVSAAVLLAALGGVASAEEFDLQALVAAAEAEPPMQVYSNTGKIVEQAEAFTKKYGDRGDRHQGERRGAARDGDPRGAGRQRAGRRDADQRRRRRRGAAPAGGLRRRAGCRPTSPTRSTRSYQDPLVIANEANVWAYNTQAYDECPIKNIWQLTEPEWKGKVALQDPLGKASYIDWFNQMATHGDDGDRRRLRGALRQAARDRRGDGDGGLGRRRSPPTARC